MTIVDRGNGPPVVLIPGIQGRWEWMEPAVDALRRTCRVITFSLADEPTCGGSFDEARGFSCYVEQVLAALDSAGVTQAAVCGVSYGGLVATAFAARHPERTAALVLVSALPPSWRPDRRVSFYLRAPRLLAPLFCLASLRLYREYATAIPHATRALATWHRHGWTAATHLFSPSRMARRVRLVASLRLADEAARVQVPTLIVTGDEQLDRVVPVESTLEYARLWPHATVARLPRTGHLGLITRPGLFADIVGRFVGEVSAAAASRGGRPDGQVTASDILERRRRG